MNLSESIAQHVGISVDDVKSVLDSPPLRTMKLWMVSVANTDAMWASGPLIPAMPEEVIDWLVEP